MAETSPRDAREITLLLKAWRQGSEEALARLAPIVEDDLRRVARNRLRNEQQGRSIETGDLVNEVYLRLVGGEAFSCRDRAHFFAIAARMMRHILVDRARRRKAERRGGGAPHLSLEEAPDRNRGEGLALEDVLTIHEALERLEAIDPRQHKVMELRVFGGLTSEDAAEVVGVSVATVKREWRHGKAWLMCELQRGGGC